MRELGPEQFRSVMGHFATGVTVVTANTPDGPVGMTANAVSSLSLEPLLLLVAFDNESRTLPVVRETGRFGVNVLAAGQAHCIEGAMVAAAALWIQGERPLLLDFEAVRDYDHVVAVFRRNGRWGAISKTNHLPLRYRDPVYRTLCELAMSYFHEYANRRGEKTLRTYSRTLDLRGVPVTAYQPW